MESKLSVVEGKVKRGTQNSSSDDQKINILISEKIEQRLASVLAQNNAKWKAKLIHVKSKSQELIEENRSLREKVQNQEASITEKVTNNKVTIKVKDEILNLKRKLEMERLQNRELTHTYTELIGDYTDLLNKYHQKYRWMRDRILMYRDFEDRRVQEIMSFEDYVLVYLEQRQIDKHPHLSKCSEILHDMKEHLHEMRESLHNIEEEEKKRGQEEEMNVKGSESESLVEEATEIPQWITDHITVKNETRVAAMFVTGVGQKRKIKPFLGTVTKYAPESKHGEKDQLYHITWDDGDEEDYDENQLILGVDQFKALSSS